MDHTHIIGLPNSHLRKSSKHVRTINDDVKKLVENMKSATLSWEDSRQHELGVALAAVQIDDLRRVVIIRNNFEDKNDRKFKVYINPEITKYEGKLTEDFEGCLSIKDVYGKVPRYEKVAVKAKDLAGKNVSLQAEGFMARIFQHEIDHTNGKVFIDHIKEMPEAFYTLKSDGSLEQLDYEKIRKNRLLW